MKESGKILLGIFIIIFSIIIGFITELVYITKFKIKDIAEIVNEESQYKVIFQEVGEPGFPFGSAKVKVTLVNSNNKIISSFDAEISNDGASAREENINVNWYKDYVEIVLNSGEQKDEIYQLEYK
ncbi:MAG: hypothetical protein HFJ51_01635 [Clostridia bacterium]|nr:hypothetical protein [Clostridia bacterium]